MIHIKLSTSQSNSTPISTPHPLMSNRVFHFYLLFILSLYPPLPSIFIFHLPPPPPPPPLPLSIFSIFFKFFMVIEYYSSFPNSIIKKISTFSSSQITVSILGSFFNENFGPSLMKFIFYFYCWVITCKIFNILKFKLNNINYFRIRVVFRNGFEGG